MWSLAVFLALPLASSSQLCLCVDECEQTLLSFLGERAATFSARNTLWRWCCLFPGPSPQAYAAVTVTGTCEEPHTAKKKNEVSADVCAEPNAFPDGV